MPEKGTQRRAVSSSEAIVRDIIRGLYEGRYVAGQRLVEPNLAEHYGVSRGTVREAVNRLSAQGIVEAQHQRGARIRQPSKSEALNMLLITEVIVGLAARQAAAKIDLPGARDSFEAALAPLMTPQHAPDPLEFARLRSRFYRAMTRIADNRELERILSNLQVHLVRNRLVIDPERRAEAYRRIGAAVLGGDEDGAEAAARAHVRSLIERLDEVFVTPFPFARDG
ncbi:GntR family transcriptional regulator [Rhodosalinus sp.]|uniref:GntR family transcriptional regulator n=1 Tax=Rhodosalinus sp. TaxID=2047741 RepID=UPI003565A08F